MRNSRVWSHFNLISKTKCECVHCNKIISRHGGTSNLIKHLSRKHQEFCFDLELNNSRILFENHAVFQDEDKVKNFICMVQMNSILYSKANEKDLLEIEKENYDSIWKEISNEFQFGEDECRKIWFTLRKQYEGYFKTKNPDKCKFINELAFLDEYIKKNRIEKIPMMKGDRDPLVDNNYDLEDESKKVLISIPDISDAPIHEISVSKTEYIDENTTEDYEILYDDYDPVMVRNQNIDDAIEDYNNGNVEPFSHEQNEWHNQSEKHDKYDRYHHQTMQYEHPKATNEFRNDLRKNISSKLEELHHSNNRQYQHRSISKTKISNNLNTPKRIKKSTDGMDEIDFFFEFLHRKLRKMSPDTSRQLQLKFMETIQEAEVRSRKRIDRSVNTTGTDTFE